MKGRKQTGRIRPTGSLPKTPPRPTKKEIPLVAISFRYAQQKYCLSDCDRNEIKQVVKGLKTMSGLTWPQMGALDWKQYEDSALGGAVRPREISPDVRIGRIAPNRVIRIFGFRHEHYFFVLWFDRRHNIVPSD